MGLRLIYVLLGFLACNTLLVQSDNPTSIVKPIEGPDPGYIVAESTTGLSNRLRVLAAYMWVAEYKFVGAHVAFIWDKTSACPGHFLQIFEPIPNVIFATNSSRYVLDKNAKIHTLIDVIIAAHAKEFKPAGFSSLSHLVDTFRSIGKGERGWCAGYES
eukprot:gene15570-17798_t